MNTDKTICSRMSNNCPSRTNCHRYLADRNQESTEATLYVRREAGATACDRYSPVLVVTTFKDESCNP